MLKLTRRACGLCALAALDDPDLTPSLGREHGTEEKYCPIHVWFDTYTHWVLTLGSVVHGAILAVTSAVPWRNFVAETPYLFSDQNRFGAEIVISQTHQSASPHGPRTLFEVNGDMSPPRVGDPSLRPTVGPGSTLRLTAQGSQVILIEY
jgi:hypothetical protein